MRRERLVDPPVIAIESLQVKRDRVRAKVRVTDAAYTMTTPRLAERAKIVFPNLALHACVNGEGPLFGCVIDHTPLPHLLEHVVVDLQVEATHDPYRVFTGATRWLNEELGTALVEVSYTDDLVAIRAFRDAAHLLNRLCSQIAYARE